MDSYDGANVENGKAIWNGRNLIAIEIRFRCSHFDLMKCEDALVSILMAMNHLRFHIVEKNPHFTRYEREHLNKKPNNTESHNNQKVQSILSDFPLNNLLNSFFIHNKPKQTTNRNNHIPIRQDRQTILLCKLFSDDINLLIAIKTFLSTN